MTAAILMLVVYVAAVWLVFFRFKLMKFNIAWGLVSIFVGVHLLLIFIIGLRFVTPYSTNATVVQYTRRGSRYFNSTADPTNTKSSNSKPNLRKPN
jgi:hypothetical protein